MAECSCYMCMNGMSSSVQASDIDEIVYVYVASVLMCQVSYTFCCDFLALLMKSAGSSDEFGPTEVVVQGLKKVIF